MLNALHLAGELSMKFVSILAIGASALALAGCQRAGQQGPKMVWVRIDGQSVRSNPKLEQQFVLDGTICKGETQKSAVGMAPIYYRGIAGAINASIIENQRESALMDVAKGCMAEKGYIYVTEQEADARFAAAAAKPRRHS
jgi:hypothetical protein